MIRPCSRRRRRSAAALTIDGGPVLLVETADCCGGGAAGDSVATLRALLELAPQDGCPRTGGRSRGGARAATGPASAARSRWSWGTNSTPRWGRPLSLTAQVVTLGDGQFRYTGGIWDGQSATWGRAPCSRPAAFACWSPVTPLTTGPTSSFARSAWTPDSAKFVVVKNPMNHRLGYAGRYREAILLDTPGPTPATLHHVAFQNLKRPYYPADGEIPGLQPRVWHR